MMVQELENEIDDYMRDFRFDGREMSAQEKLDRRTYFQELVRLQRELIATRLGSGRRAYCGDI
ncbi:hypothetical protein [Psychrobacter immobilis]|uniref:hypothetical protein n=1 Tax=Psychrobacter immobilis TaxID=498 RepID=UPI001D10AB12|nr:hypothetical protein [Psychrobacter immobilis]